MTTAVATIQGFNAGRLTAFPLRAAALMQGLYVRGRAGFEATILAMNTRWGTLAEGIGNNAVLMALGLTEVEQVPDEDLQIGLWLAHLQDDAKNQASYRTWGEGAPQEEVAASLAAEREGQGPAIAELGTADPGPPRAFDARGLEMWTGDALELLPTLAEASVDLVATDPPYNIQLPLTMAGGSLAETHANRRTDYAMVSEAPADLANAADYPSFLDAMERAFRELARILKPGRYAIVIVRDAYQNGRYQFVGADLAARADAAGLVPKGDLIWHQAGTRLRPYGYPRAFVPNIAHQHILVFRREPAGNGQARRRLSR